MKVKLVDVEELNVLYTEEGHILHLNSMALGPQITGETDPTVPSWIKRLSLDDCFIIDCGTSTEQV